MLKKLIHVNFLKFTLLFLFLISILHHTQCAASIRFSPEEIYQNIKDFPNHDVYDFGDYINDSNSPQIKSNVEKIYNFGKFTTKIFVISEMSLVYGPKGDKNIGLFVADLAYLYLSGDTQKEDNSIFILFSIEDR